MSLQEDSPVQQGIHSQKNKESAGLKGQIFSRQVITDTGKDLILFLRLKKVIITAFRKLMMGLK